MADRTVSSSLAQAFFVSFLLLQLVSGCHISPTCHVFPSPPMYLSVSQSTPHLHLCPFVQLPLSFFASLKPNIARLGCQGEVKRSAASSCHTKSTWQNIGRTVERMYKYRWPNSRCDCGSLDLEFTLHAHATHCSWSVVSINAYSGSSLSTQSNFPKYHYQY
jgi:hypothetical protein